MGSLIVGNLRANLPIIPVIRTVDLRLPDSVGHAPQPGQDEEEVRLRRVGLPSEEGGHHAQVDESAADKDGHPPDVLDDEAEAEGADGVADAVDDQDVAEVLHPIGAGHVALEKASRFETSLKKPFFSSESSSHSGEVRSEESLLDSGPERERDDEQLVGLLQVLEGGHQQLHPGHLALFLVALILTVPAAEKNSLKNVLYTVHHELFVAGRLTYRPSTVHYVVFFAKSRFGKTHPDIAKNISNYPRFSEKKTLYPTSVKTLPIEGSMTCDL